MDTKLIKNISS